MKQFFRQYGRLTLALAAVLAFCAVSAAAVSAEPVDRNRVVGPELPDGGPAARRQRVKGGAAAL
ncbi:MAG: hypothetical protein ACLU3I_02000 [Acutalibacteraceae bacterium]